MYAVVTAGGGCASSARTAATSAIGASAALTVRKKVVKVTTVQWYDH